MEDKKDNRIDFRTKGLINYTEKSKFFRDNGRMSFIHQKAVKLGNVLYRITDSFPKNEPLKLELRAGAIQLIKDTASMSYNSDGWRQKIEEGLISQSGILELAFSSNLISPMNFSIIENEFGQLLEVLGGTDQPAYFQSEDISKEDIEVVRDLLQSKSINLRKSVQEREILSKGQYQGQAHLDAQDLDVQDGKRDIKVKDMPVSIKGQFNLKDHSKRPIVKNVGYSREKVILDSIKEKGEVSVKDISHLIPGVSEKTIQRELVSMVSRGVLKKEGERRWSKYSII